MRLIEFFIFVCFLIVQHKFSEKRHFSCITIIYITCELTTSEGINSYGRMHQTDQRFFVNIHSPTQIEAKLSNR